MSLVRRSHRILATVVAVLVLAGGGAVAGATLAPRAAATVAPTSFPDVPDDTFFSDAVAWALDEGITTGVGSTGRFFPLDPVDRAQMVTFLRRLADRPITLRHSTFELRDTSGQGWIEVVNNIGFTNVENTDGTSRPVRIPLDGPARLGATDVTLRSMRYCFQGPIGGPGSIESVAIAGIRGDLTPPTPSEDRDTTVRSTAGCYTVDYVGPPLVNWYGEFVLTQGTNVGFYDITTTWAPAP